MPSIGIYHGDEEWVLKGIGQDLANAFKKLGFSNVYTTDEVFKRTRLKTDIHIFVQQGQLNANCDKSPSLVPENTVCLFTHLDISNFRPDILEKCRVVVFNSSIQLSQAIANGYNPKNAILHPHAVDSSMHKLISEDHPLMSRTLDLIQAQGKVHSYKTSIGFCGRYWNKHTYTRRKNYNLVKQVITKLIELNFPVVVLGPGWSDFLNIDSPYLLCVETRYSNYPYVYNLMKIFASLSIHEGGPLPLLESMSCGAYPICSNTGFAFDILNSSEVGCLISPFIDAKTIVNKISNLYTKDLNFSACISRANNFTFIELARKICKGCKL